ncbi:MAG: PAS domain-containing protein, partial [Methanoregula sp.]
SEIRRARELAENVINTIREPLVVLDPEFKVVSASGSFYTTFRTSAVETIGKNLFELGNHQWNIPKLRELLETVLPQKTSFENIEVDHVFPGIGRRKMLLNGRRIMSDRGESRLILLAIEDITNQLPVKERKGRGT